MLLLPVKLIALLLVLAVFWMVPLLVNVDDTPSSTALPVELFEITPPALLVIVPVASNLTSNVESVAALDIVPELVMVMPVVPELILTFPAGAGPGPGAGAGRGSKSAPFRKQRKFHENLLFS